MDNNDIVPGFNDEKDDSLKIKLDTDGSSNSLILYLNGYIDTYNLPFFKDRIAFVVKSGRLHLTFECSELHYLSSTGVAAFTTILKKVKAQGGDMILLNIKANVYDVFQLLGFSQVFTMQNNRDDTGQ
jgi:anti-anti-sigma factor